MTYFQMTFVPLMTEDGDLVNIPPTNWNVVPYLQSGYLQLSANYPNIKNMLRYTIDLRKVFLLNIQQQTEVNAVGRTLGRTALTGIASSIFTKGGTNPLGGGLLDLSLRGLEKDTVVCGTLYFSPSSLEVDFSLSGDTFAQLLKWIPKDALSEERTELAIRDINLVKEMKRDGRIAIDELANSLVQKNNELSELLAAIEKGATIEIRHKLRQEASLKESELNRLKGFFISLLYINGLSLRVFKATSACGPELERMLLGSSEFLATKYYNPFIAEGYIALVVIVALLIFYIMMLTMGQKDAVKEPANPVIVDYVEAVKSYRKAAEQGSADAQNNLGVMYNNAWGVTQDYAEAVKWYRKAAEQGLASAQNNLGVMYNNAWGVTKDDAEAVKWFRKAAEQGNADARKTLRVMGYSFTPRH